MAYKVFIDGQAGTTGLRIAERLAVRDDLKLLEIEEDRRKEIDARLTCISEADITILCLPDESAKEIVAAECSKARIIDASTVHRVSDGWVYGMPELDGAGAIVGAIKVANPGCHATGYIMTIRPLVDAGIIDPNTMLSCYSLSGYSGGGKSMIADYQQDPLPDRFDAPRLYGLGQVHKHIPEMQKYSGVVNKPVFSPIVSGYYAGMIVGVPIPIDSFLKSVSVADIYKVLTEYYDGRKLVHVRQPGDEFSEENYNGYLSANTFVNRDDIEIFATGNDDRIMLVSRYDNLGKGASGAAIQNMNIMLGLPEDTGLEIGA